LIKLREEIIKSFGVKQNDGLYLEGEKDTIMTPMDPIRYYKHFLQWFDGYGTTNRKHKKPG
jgi:penicillin-binding protein 1A